MNRHHHKTYMLRPSSLAVWFLVVFAVVGIGFFLLFVVGMNDRSNSAIASVGERDAHSLLRGIPVFFALNKQGDNAGFPFSLSFRNASESKTEQPVACGESLFPQCGTGATTNRVLSEASTATSPRKTLLRTIRSEFIPSLRNVYPSGNKKRTFVYGNISVPTRKEPVVVPPATTPTVQPPATQPTVEPKKQEEQPSLLTFFTTPQEPVQPEIEVTVNAKNVTVTPDNTAVISLYLAVKPLEHEIYIQAQNQTIQNISATTKDAEVDYTVVVVSGLQKKISDGLLVFPKGRSQVLFVRATMKDFEKSGLYEFSFDSLAYEDASKNVFYHPIPGTDVRGIYRHNNKTLTLSE